MKVDFHKTNQQKCLSRLTGLTFEMGIDEDLVARLYDRNTRGARSISDTDEEMPRRARGARPAGLGRASAKLTDRRRVVRAPRVELWPALEMRLRKRYPVVVGRLTGGGRLTRRGRPHEPRPRQSLARGHVRVPLPGRHHWQRRPLAGRVRPSLGQVHREHAVARPEGRLAGRAFVDRPRAGGSRDAGRPGRMQRDARGTWRVAGYAGGPGPEARGPCRWRTTLPVVHHGSAHSRALRPHQLRELAGQHGQPGLREVRLARWHGAVR